MGDEGHIQRTIQQLLQEVQNARSDVLLHVPVRTLIAFEGH